MAGRIGGGPESPPKAPFGSAARHVGIMLCCAARRGRRSTLGGMFGDNGRAALDALAAQSFDLVLLDVGLGPGPDGVEVCRRLRGAGEAAHVVAVTARDGEADAVLALEAGADDYVTKPVGIAEL